MAFVCSRAAAGVAVRAARSTSTKASKSPSSVRRVAARAQAADTTNWRPGLEKPAYLEGLPCNYGFDPLSLGEDPEQLAWNVQAELVHARFAMLGSAGILIPAALTKYGLWNVPAWNEAGAADFGFADAATLLFTQLIFMGFAEYKRYYDFVEPGSQGQPGSFLGLEKGFAGGGAGKTSYPGGFFDPLSLSNDAEMFQKMQVREIANGRLAMLAMLGIYGETSTTGMGPIDAWQAHLADPWHNTVVEYMLK